MLREAYHPKAFLSIKRNVRPGLTARTRIVSLLEKEASNAKTVAQRAKLSYGVVLHHLHLLETESIVTRKGKRPYLWELTGAGQQRLTNTHS
jgi:predicted ArsR family transcriptional regulator